MSGRGGDIRHCEDCGEPLGPDDLTVSVREWDALHAKANQAQREADSLAERLRGAVEVDNAMVERFRESLWSTWGAGRQTTDWPTRAQLHAALDAALEERSS